MKQDRNIDLYSQNTMRLHSIADVVYYPESYYELQELIKQKEDFLILAAGSNVILPPKLSRPVISLMSLNNRLDLLDDGRVCAGCSVRIQKLIKFLAQNNQGGIEYLYSVPASVGGLVYMNGGRGRKYNSSISDYLESVEYLDLNEMAIKTYEAKKSDFTYRHSPFQEMHVIILMAYFNFRSQDSTITESLIKERLDYSKSHLSADKPSCGSVFRKGNRIVFRLLKGMRKGGAMYSKKTSNWISNVDNATYDDVCGLIKRGQALHKLFLSSCKPEVIIIKE